MASRLACCVTALRDPTRRYYTALWKHVPEDHGEPGTPDPPMNELHGVHRREFTKRGG